MPTLFLVTDKPVDFTISGGWGRGYLTSQKWAPKSADFLSPAVLGFDLRNMPASISVTANLPDAVAIALGGEKQLKRAPNQGYAILEIDYSGDPLPQNNLLDGTVNTYPVESAKCRFTGVVRLQHIHNSLKDVAPLAAQNSFDDDVGLVSGERRPQSRWARVSTAVRSAPYNAWHYVRGNRNHENLAVSSSATVRRDDYARGGFRAGLRAFGRSIYQTAKNWGPVFLMASAGIALFYFTGGTSFLMNLFASMGAGSAAAASLTTVCALGAGIASVGVCKAAYKGISTAVHYGSKSADYVKVRYVDFTESRAETANDAQHQQALLLAEQLGYDLEQDDSAPAKFETAYAQCDTGHRAKLLQRELLMFTQAQAADKDKKPRTAAEEAALADLAAIVAEPQRRRPAPGAPVTAH